MRTILIILLIIAALLTSCRARQMVPADYPEPPPDEQIAEMPEEPVEPEEIPVVEESFEFEREDDEIDHKVNRFFVILGSFRVSENAAKFKAELEEKGFDPVILLSETGFNRVCVDSFSEEAEARQRVMQIRRSYPEYYDAWLLIRRDM